MIVDETHEASRKILSRLITKPMRQHEACERAMHDSLSIKKALTIFYWLRDKGVIRKTGLGYCSPYEVTEKCMLFYQMLSWENK